MDSLDPLGILKSPKERAAAQSIADLLRPYSPETRAQAIQGVSKLLAEKDQKEKELAEDKLRLAAIDGLKQWYDGKPKLTLEKNDCSRLHMLVEAARTGKLISPRDNIFSAKPDLPGGNGVWHPFVVKHDWAEAFAHAEGLEDQIRFPYNVCCFEFRVAGKTIILVCFQLPETDTPRIFEFIESHGYWYMPPRNVDADELSQYLRSQVRAICIALDAEVATHSVVRAPHRLNEKRTRDGKVPLSDYHVVDLAKRHRVANPSAGNTGRHVRLHFRRGHWRHFETTKTWVRWCLVGDPDLGFIQKSYTL